MTEPAFRPITPPPGWYAEPTTGRRRWWDGIQWAFYPPEQDEVGAGVPSYASAGPTPTNPYSGVAYPTSYRHPTNGMATASLVLGIVGLVMCTLVVPSALAVIFGIFGIQRARLTGGLGRAKAIWGLVLGGFILSLMAIVVISGPNF